MPAADRRSWWLGPKLKDELFGAANALGAHVHIGGRRFVVVGIMEPKGQMLGFDLDDSAYIPVSLALKLFNKDGLQEIDVLFAHEQQVDSIVAGIRRVLRARHDGEEDFTLVTQTEMLESLNGILDIITMVVGAIAAISLLVASVGILTMMWISVNERVSEIGLEKAIGAEPRQILWLFLSEAAFLSSCGGAAGVVIGLAIAQTLGIVLPALPVRVPFTYSSCPSSSASPSATQPASSQRAAPLRSIRSMPSAPSDHSPSAPAKSSIRSSAALRQAETKSQSVRSRGPWADWCWA